MKTSYLTPFLFTVTLAAGLAMGTEEAAAQPSSTVSDIVAVFVGNQQVDGRVITELDEIAAMGGPIPVPIRGLALDFLEPNGSLSDRLLINPYVVTITSDLDDPRTGLSVGLPRRPGATAVRGESFLPFALEIASDPDPTRPGDESDVITVFINGVRDRRIPILEVRDEPGVTVQVGPLFFDLFEDDLVSDYVDIDLITFSFTSDLPGGGGVFPPVPAGFIIAPPVRGVEFQTYELRFTSDVPEPATLLLLGTGLVGLVGFRRHFTPRRDAA